MYSLVFGHGIDITRLVATHGYWMVAAIVGLESAGLPLPGEATLIAGAAFAGATHQLDIRLVILAAATGAILGDNIGYSVGRRFGFSLLRRHGPRIGLTPRRLQLGEYLFQHHGGKIVFFGRFVALLRVGAALLAGANRMPWPRFFAFNAAGGICWAMLFGASAYAFSTVVRRISGPLGLAFLVIAVGALVVGAIILRRHETRLLFDAEQALGGEREFHQRFQVAERESGSHPLE